MLTLNGKNLLLGGFHDHWTRADRLNPTVLWASLNYYHYDFVTLMCGGKRDDEYREMTPVFSDHIRLYAGREEAFGWGHIVTVGPTAPELPSGDPDYRGALRKLQKTCDLVILAHPPYIAWESLVETGELDKLLDEGLLDGIQFITDRSEVAGTRDALMWDWYRDRERRGHRTAVVGGWDVHLMKAFKRMPAVLYDRSFEPDGHYEAPCSSRTILFAEENTHTAICQAVKAGQTVVERMPTGELYGPSDLVSFLKDSGYRQAVAELDRQRDAVALRIERPLMAGEPGRLTVSQSGRLRLPVTLNEATSVTVTAGQAVDWPVVPTLLERDRAYLPVTWQGADGRERLWAVDREHPIQLDVLPLLGEGKPAMEVAALREFEGTVDIRIEGVDERIRQEIRGTTRVELPAAAPLPVVRYEMRATNRAGISRGFGGCLTYFGVTRFKGDWSAVPTFGVDTAEFVPKHAYGAGRPWPGAQVYSAQLQFAWTPEALLMRATVRDAVHFQPFHGHYGYNADCLQLAIDPMARRNLTLGNVYSFNLMLTGSGPEAFRTWSPNDEATESFRPPGENQTLGNRYLKATPWEGGLVYELALPWEELAPVRPEAGHRMGIYYIMFNNNGTGHLDVLHWPNAKTGNYFSPVSWGMLTLLGA